jgi:hypothetical protein
VDIYVAKLSLQLSDLFCNKLDSLLIVAVNCDLLISKCNSEFS